MTAPIDQMRLPLQSDLPDGAAGFVVSECNRAAVEAVADWPNLIGGVMAICGPAGCGKSRLGQMWAERVGAVAIHGGEAAVIDRWRWKDGRSCWIGPWMPTTRPCST